MKEQEKPVEEIKLEEFHSACNGTQPVRKCFQPEGVSQSLTRQFQQPAKGTSAYRRQGFGKARSSTIYISSRASGKELFIVTPERPQLPDPKEPRSALPKPSAGQLDSGPSRVGIANEDQKDGKSKVTQGARPPFLKQNSEMHMPTDMDKPAVEKWNPRGTVPKQLSRFAQPEPAHDVASPESVKQMLADSLSPSPFQKDYLCAEETKLEQLIAAASPTKRLLFSPFYGSEVAAGTNTKMWKKALKEHFVHTLESICLIKKFKPLPSEIIESKRQELAQLYGPSDGNSTNTNGNSNGKGKGTINQANSYRT
jgi:hypothetical protein